MTSVLSKKDIVGTYPVNSQIPASSSITEKSVMRVQFVKNNLSNYIYSSVHFCVVRAEDVKVFVGIYYDQFGNAFPLIQIPLYGQSVNDLCEKLNKYPDILASPIYGYEYLNSALLNETALSISTGNEYFFEVDNLFVNSNLLQLQENIKFYLTSAESLAEQKNLVQSYGGYRSTSEVYRGFVLQASLSIYDQILYVSDTSLSGNFGLLDLQKAQYLQINDEIVEVSRWSGTTAYLAKRNVFDTGLRFHSAGSVVREIYKNNFFDKNFDNNRLQYRCICIRNENSSNVVKDVRVFFNTQDTNNLSSLKIAIEIPSSDYFSGASSSTGSTSFSVDALAGLHVDDHYVGAPIIFITGANIGQKRFVRNFISNSGNIILNQKLPYNIAVGDLFYIDTAPATRARSPYTAPIGPKISDFYEVTDYKNYLSINTQGMRQNGGDLAGYEAIYVWIERSINLVNDEYKDNRFSLSLSYSRV